MQNLKFFLPSLKELISYWPQIKSISQNWDFWPIESLEQSMKSPENFPVFAERNSTLVGLIFWKLALDEAELLYIFVPEDFRGKGLAHQLLNYSIDQLATQGCKSIYLEVRPSNDSAIKLYLKNGFLEISRRKRYYADGEDCLVMMKGLNS